MGDDWSELVADGNTIDQIPAGQKLENSNRGCGVCVCPVIALFRTS